MRGRQIGRIGIELLQIPPQGAAVVLQVFHVSRRQLGQIGPHERGFVGELGQQLPARVELPAGQFPVNLQ